MLLFPVIAVSAWYGIAEDEIGPVVENYREGFFWKKLRNFQFKNKLFVFRKFEKKNYGPVLWMGFNWLKARATSRRQFTFYH